MADSNKLVSLNSILEYIREHGVINKRGSDPVGETYTTVPPQINLIPGSTNWEGKVVITGLGPVIIGGGESGANFEKYGTAAITNESTYILADGSVAIRPGFSVDSSNNISYTGWTFSSNGKFTDPDGDEISGLKIHSQVQDDTIEIASSTSWSSVATITIPAKRICLIEIAVRFPSNTTGYRAVNVSSTAGGTRESHRFQDMRTAVPTTFTYCHLVFTYSNTDSSDRTRYINLIQNSGSTMSGIILTYRITEIGKNY